MSLRCMKHFRVEAKEFLDLLGSRDFWALPDENRLAAIKGLSYAASIVDDDPDGAIHLLGVVLGEYHMREELMTRLSCEATDG